MWREFMIKVGARRLNLTRMIKEEASTRRTSTGPPTSSAAARTSRGRRPRSAKASARASTRSRTWPRSCRAHGLPASGTKAKQLRDYASGVEPSKGKRRRGA